MQLELQYKQDFERTRKYWRAFWEKEIIDRPLVCVIAPKKDAVPVSKPPYMDGWAGDYSSALQRFERWAGATYFGGEALPCFEPCFGPDQFSAFLGAELIMSPEKATSWVQPFVMNWGDVNISLINSRKYNLESMKQYMKFAAQYAEDKFLISMLDLHADLDCLSAISGPEKLCMDLLDCPDEVERVLNIVRTLYYPIYEEIFEAGNMKKYGSMGWAPTYCDGKFAVLQCDFACMISPDLARRFVIPAIREEASYLDHSVYHIDGKEALVHLNEILNIPQIDVIQWVPGAGQPRTVEWMDLLKKIQSAGKGIWLYDWTITEIKLHHRELQPNGLVYQVEAASQQEAEELIEWLKNNT